MNRAILAGSIIVGIAVMISISTIAPALAASPWKDLWTCADDSVTPWAGTETFVKGHTCGFIPASQAACIPRGPTTDGHVEFMDKNGDDERQIADEKFRCVRGATD